MNRKSLAALLGAVVMALAASGAAAAASGTGPASGAAAAASGTGPAVSVSVKSLTKTLLAPTSAHGEKGWITKGGTPHGKCSGNSAAGALDAATHGKWTGEYFKSVGGIFVTSILGVKPPSKDDFWEVVVNGKPASTGICGVKLRAGEKLLFKIAK
jgi:Domain of unknown function (DUF4430)